MTILLINDLPANDRPESRGIQPILCRCCSGGDGSCVGKGQADRSRVDPNDLYLLGAVQMSSVRSVLVRCADTRMGSTQVVVELCRSSRCDRSNSIDWLLSVAVDFVAMDFVVAAVSIGCVDIVGQQCQYPSQ